MDVDESVVADAAEYLLAAFYRSKSTGLRSATVDPLNINGEFDNFIRKISFKVRSLIQTVEHGEQHMNQVDLSTSPTCRLRDVLIFDDTSAVVEARQQGGANQALSMSSTEDPFLLDLNAQGPELCIPPPNTTQTLMSQLEDINSHQPTSNANQSPQENEHNRSKIAPVKEPSQVGSNQHLKKARKRRQNDTAPVPNRLRTRKKPAATSRSALSTQTYAAFGDVLEKLASPRVILQLREMLGRFPTSKISISLNVSDAGLRELFVRIIDRDNICQIQTLAQFLDIHHLYQMFYQQISGQSSRAFEVLTPRSIRPSLSGNPILRREKAVTEKFVETMLSQLNPVKPAARKYCKDISKFGGRLYDMVDILGEPIVCLLVFAGAKEEHALDWRRNTLFVALDSDFKLFLGERRTSAHIEYLQDICAELRVVVDFLRGHERWTEAVPLHTLDAEHISQCANGARELSDAIREACQVKTVHS
ncbi:hypothetical protein LTR49_020761 [Elasticomyces elasticus]|nr:hypothetical protein LTR49_020761 [Elasticomyces elasticus]